MTLSRNLVIAIILVIVLIALPVTIYLVRQQQTLKSKASIGQVNFTLTPTSMNVVPGGTFQADLKIEAGNINLDGAQAEVTFSSSQLMITGFDQATGSNIFQTVDQHDFSTPGVFKYRGFTISTPRNPVTGSVSLGRLTFSVPSNVAAGTQATIAFNANTTGVNSNDGAVDYRTTPTTITIGATTSPSSSPSTSPSASPSSSPSTSPSISPSPSASVISNTGPCTITDVHWQTPTGTTLVNLGTLVTMVAQATGDCSKNTAYFEATKANGNLGPGCPATNSTTAEFQNRPFDSNDKATGTWETAITPTQFCGQVVDGGPIQYALKGGIVTQSPNGATATNNLKVRNPVPNKVRILNLGAGPNTPDFSVATCYSQFTAGSGQTFDYTAQGAQIDWDLTKNAVGSTGFGNKLICAQFGFSDFNVTNDWLSYPPIITSTVNYQSPPPPVYDVQGNIFIDTNKNSVKDAGEVGWSGQTGVFIPKETPFSLSLGTDSSGNFTFHNVPAGTYKVSLVSPNASLASPLAPDAFIIRVPEGYQVATDNLVFNYTVPSSTPLNIALIPNPSTSPSPSASPPNWADTNPRCFALFDLYINSSGNACGDQNYNKIADINKDKRVDQLDNDAFESQTNGGTNEQVCINLLNNQTNPCTASPSPSPSASVTSGSSNPGCQRSNGDADGDGSVTILKSDGTQGDFFIWKAAYLNDSAGQSFDHRADFNCDGHVNVLKTDGTQGDFFIWKNGYLNQH